MGTRAPASAKMPWGYLSVGVRMCGGGDSRLWCIQGGGGVSFGYESVIWSTWVLGVRSPGNMVFTFLNLPRGNQ